jgi:hypothetical protein
MPWNTSRVPSSFRLPPAMPTSGSPLAALKMSPDDSIN